MLNNKITIFVRFNYKANNLLLNKYNNHIYVEHYKDNQGRLTIITHELIHGYSNRIIKNIDLRVEPNSFAYLVHNPFIKIYHFGKIISKQIIGVNNKNHVIKYELDNCIILDKE